MSTSYLFHRQYSVTLKSPTSDKAIVYGNIDGEQSALRVTFSLERKTESAPNKGTLTLYNLNATTRAAIAPGWLVRLRCGYEGQVSSIFVGIVGLINQSREGPDVATQMQITEGFVQLLQTPFQKTYPKNTHLAQILSDIAQAMNVAVGVVRDLPDKVFTRGITISSNCRDALTLLLNPLKMEASVAAERLNILPQEAALSPTAVLISKETGMIQTPTVDKLTVSFDALLLPALCVPGQLCQIVTSNKLAQGFFKLRSIKIEGDSHGEKWGVSCTCARVKNYQAVPNLARGYDFSYAVEQLL